MGKSKETKESPYYHSDKQKYPFEAIPLNHVVECPTNWLMDPNLKPMDICVLLVFLAHATSDLKVQISRKQIGRSLGISYETAKKTVKRLVKFKYLTRLKYPNGFAPIFKVNPMLSGTKKRKTKKSNVFKGKGLSAEDGAGSNGYRGPGS